MGHRRPLDMDLQASLCTQLFFLKPRSLPSRLEVPEPDSAQAPAPTLSWAWYRLSSQASVGWLRVKASPVAGPESLGGLADLQSVHLSVCVCGWVGGEGGLAPDRQGLFSGLP